MSTFNGFETILVIDDETAMLRLSTVMLERRGYRVLTAASGHEAVHLLNVRPAIEVDLALVDIVMPGMNGLEFAEQIRATRPGIRILFCSAYSEQEILRPVIARGVPYIAKPFTSVQLAKRIRELLDKSEPSAASAPS